MKAEVAIQSSYSIVVSETDCCDDVAGSSFYRLFFWKNEYHSFGQTTDIKFK